jgi:hypothetical protein
VTHISRYGKLHGKHCPSGLTGSDLILSTACEAACDSPVYRGGKRGPERVSNLPKVTVCGRVRISEQTVEVAYVKSHLCAPVK